MRKRIISLILAVLLIQTVYAGIEEKFKKYYNRGKVFLKNKEYAKAIKEFKKALEYKPDYAQIYLDLGIIYDEKLHNYAKAIEYYILYIKKGGEKKDQVKEWIKNITNLRIPTTDKEFKKLKKAIRLYNEGVKAGKKRKFFKAIEKFKKAIEIAPFYVKSQYSLGVAYFTTKQFDKALTPFLNAIKFDPDNPDIVNSYYYLGLLYDDLLIKDYETAYKFYNYYVGKGGSKITQVQQLLKPLKEVNKYIEQAIQYIKKKKYNKAEGLLLKARRLKPFDIRVLNDLAIVYIHVGKFEKAKQVLKEALNINAESAYIYYNYMCLYDKIGEPEIALRYFKKGVKYFPEELLKRALKDKDLKVLQKNKEFRKIIKNYLDTKR